MRSTGAASILHLVLLPTFLRSVLSEDASRIVYTSSGYLYGYHHSSHPVTDAFLGVPFAEPPVGRLRFRKPEPATIPDQIRGALYSRAPCYQAVNREEYPGDRMLKLRWLISEDCLYLDIWVPVPRPTKAAVMVWIHGGAFTTGSKSLDMYDGRYLANEQKVIVVTLAYRLGIFGFLYLGDESAPGNQGLHDQVMGLQWVHDNIEKFGGDPNNVTLFGNGAGATSVSLHLLSPLSINLFHRVIIQGGGTGLPGMGFQTNTPEEAKRRALLFAFEYLECPRNETPASIIACMMDISPEYLIAEQFFPYSSVIFKPCVDGKFLTRPVDEALRDGHFKKCPLLIGTVKDQGSLFVFRFAPEYLNLTHRSMNRDQFVVIMRRIFSRYPDYPTRTSSEFRDKMIELYTAEANPDDTDTNLAALSAAYGDAYFYCPMNEYATFFAMHGLDVYSFQLTQRFEKNPWPEWMGVVHGDEVYFVFGAAPASGLDLTPEEKLLSKAMMTYWANFARTGNPNNPPSAETVGVWPKFNEESGYAYIDLNLQYFTHDGSSRSDSTKQRLRDDACSSLIEVLTKLGIKEQISNTASKTIVSLAVIASRLLFSFLAPPTTCD